MRRRFAYSVPVATGDALVAGDVDPVMIARIEGASLPGRDLPITADVDVFDVPGEAFLLKYGDGDGRRYVFTDGDGLDELADDVVDDNSDLVELRPGPFEDRLEGRYYVVDEQAEQDETQGVDA